MMQIKQRFVGFSSTIIIIFAYVTELSSRAKYHLETEDGYTLCVTVNGLRDNPLPMG